MSDQRLDSSQRPNTVRAKTVMFLDHTASMGGGEFALLHLVQRLDHTRYVPVVVLCSDGPLREELEKSGVEVHVLKLSSGLVNTRKDSLGVRSSLQVSAMFRLLAYCRRLARFIRRRRVDILHTNSLKADIIGGVAARMAGIPVIWHIRDRIENDYLPAPVVRVFRWMCRILPDQVITNSHATLQTLHLPPAKAVTTIYSGVTNAISASETPVSVVHDGVIEHPITRSTPDESTQIGIIGRITRWKGQHIFLQAASEIHREFPQSRFLIIGSALFGEDDYKQELHDLVQKLQLQDCVEFTGFVPNVREYLSGLDVLVHASVTSEPFGLVVVEGMVAGKPIVATKGGGVIEIVQDGTTGILVPMGDAGAMACAVKELLRNPQRAEAMGRAGRQRVQEHFTIELTAQRVQEVYDQLWQRRHSREN